LAQKVERNKTNIDNLNTKQQEHETKISNNIIKIADNDSDIVAIENTVSENIVKIKANKTNIASNIVHINNYSAQMNDNTNDINQNKTDIQVLSGSLNSVKNNVATNKSNIAENLVLINALKNGSWGSFSSSKNIPIGKIGIFGNCKISIIYSYISNSKFDAYIINTTVNISNINYKYSGIRNSTSPCLVLVEKI
jgi:hypothetical protein